MLEECALNCKHKFRAVQKLAEALAQTASRTDLMRQQANTPPVRTRASLAEMAEDGSNDSEGVSGRGWRRRSRNRTKNGNNNPTETVMPGLPSSQRTRKSTGSVDVAKVGSNDSESVAGRGGDEGIAIARKTVITIQRRSRRGCLPLR